MSKKEAIELHDHSLEIFHLSLQGYQEECMKHEPRIQGVKHFKNKKIRQYFSFTITLIFWFIRQINEGEVSHFIDFAPVKAIRTFVLKELAKQFRNPLGFWCQILPWHKEELMAAITLPAAASMFLKHKPLDFLRISEILFARKQLINKDGGLRSGLIFLITETFFAVHFISNSY